MDDHDLFMAFFTNPDRHTLALMQAAQKVSCRRVHDPEKARPGLDPGWNRFSDKIMHQQKRLRQSSLNAR